MIICNQEMYSIIDRKGVVYEKTNEYVVKTAQ